MRRAAGQPLLTALGAVLLLCGCGGGATVAAGSAPEQGARGPSAPVIAPSGPAAPRTDDRGTLAEDHAYLEDFSEVSGSWPDPDAFGDDGYTLAAGEVVPVPYAVPTSALGGLAEVGVTMRATGATTLTCDLGSTGGTVAVELRAEGGWSLDQTRGGAVTELAGGTLDPGQRGEPGELTAVRLLCTSSPDGLAVGVSLHGADVTFVDGAAGEVPADGPTWTVASTGQAPSLLSAVLVTLVEA